jgi:TIR domain
VEEADRPPGHAFISYVREDSRKVDRLQRKLEAAGVRVWRDRADLRPGEDWQAKVRHAITDNALVFIACFSRTSMAREKSYQNEELVLAIEQLRLRRPDVPWLIPVRFDDCKIPEYGIGGGRTLASIQCADLFGKRYAKEASWLVSTALQILGTYPSSRSVPGTYPTSPRPTVSAGSPRREFPLQPGSRSAESRFGQRELFGTHPYTAIAALAGLFTLIVAMLVWSPWKHAQGSTPPQARASESGPSTSGTSTPNPVSTSRIRWRTLPTGSWHNFGIARVLLIHDSVMSLVFNRTLSAANKWAGVMADIPASCRYAITLQARVASVMNGGTGGGYGVASGGLGRNFLPEGPAFQYDIGFGGYRALTYPNDWQTPYHVVAGQLDHRWHRILIIFDNGMTVYVDGQRVFSRPASQSCGVPIIRVWSATADFRNIKVGQV